MLAWTYRPGFLVLGLGLLLAAGVVATLYLAARRRTTGPRLVALILLRLGFVTGILICLLDPHLIHETRVVQPTRPLVLIDTTRSMLEQDEQSTRLERAQHWWQSQKSSDPAPKLMGFDESLHPLKSEETWTATSKGGTSLAAVLKSASAQPLGDPIGGIILVSDGRITDGESPLAAARALEAQGIPVSTLTIGHADPKPFLQIQAISVPPSVPSETPVKAVVTFQSANIPGESGILRIKSGATILAERELKFSGENQTVELSFQPPSTPSLQICEAELDLANPRPGVAPEILPFALRVVNPTIRVLYMEGSPNGEILYLQRSLQLDPQIKVDILQRPQSLNDSNFLETSVNPDDGSLIYDVENPIHGYPRTMEQMLQYDVIINSDIFKEAFSEDQLKMTERFVEEFGGGFAMVGGYTSFGQGGYNYTVIDKIIPVAMENEKDIREKTFTMRPTPEGLNHPIMSLGTTPEETRRIWRDKSPRLYGFNAVDRPKPGAVVLADVPNTSNENGPYVLLATQEVGNGRSMAYTSDTTRAWGVDFETIWGEPIDPQQGLSEQNCDTCYFRKFWNNAIRWLAAKRLAQKNVIFTIETSKRRVNAGDNFTVHVTRKAAVRSSSDPSPPPDFVALQITDLASNEVVKKLSVPLRSDTNDYVSNLNLSHSGRYLIDLENADKTAPVCAPAVITCDTTDPELADTRADPALMAEIAKITGGQVLSESSTDELRLTSQMNSTAGHMEYQQESLWDQGWVLVVLAGSLFTEWILRRRWSLI